VERVLTDIDADYGNCSLCWRRHGVLLVLAPPGPLIAGGAGARPDHPISGHRADRNPASAAVSCRIVYNAIVWVAAQERVLAKTLPQAPIE
jgi:hypothetical protein